MEVLLQDGGQGWPWWHETCFFFTLRLRCPVQTCEMQTQAQMQVQENENFSFLASALALAFAFALRLFTGVFSCVCICICFWICAVRVNQALGRISLWPQQTSTILSLWINQTQTMNSTTYPALVVLHNFSPLDLSFYQLLVIARAERQATNWKVGDTTGYQKGNIKWISNYLFDNYFRLKA